jgi:hypothetical protein
VKNHYLYRLFSIAKGSAMKWETPSFVEINMSAEIGGYQSDFDGQDPVAPAAPRPQGAQSADGTQPARD